MTAGEEMKMKKQVMLKADVVCTTLNHSGSSLLWEVLKPAVEDGKRTIRFGSVIVDEVYIFFILMSFAKLFYAHNTRNSSWLRLTVLIST